MKSFTLLATACLLTSFTATATATATAIAGPPTAEEVLAKAQAKALTEHKAVFVHFGASWCGWCKRLNAFLDAPEVKPVFEKYFVPVELIVQESAENKGKENPGGDAALKKMGGPEGLPFHAFLDADGKLIVNSKRPDGAGGPGGNIGFPNEPQEVDWFMQMVKKAAPQITEADLKTLQAGLAKLRKT